MSNYSEYPRPEMSAPPGYGRGPGVYFDAIGEAWTLVWKDAGHWIAATILYFVIGWVASLPGSLITGALMPGATRSATPNLGAVFPILGLQLVLSLIPTALTNVLMVGMIAMGVRKSRGEYINVSMIFEPFTQFGRVFGSSMLYSVIVFAAILACVLPALYFAPVLALMPTVAYLRGINPVESLSLTYDTCKSHWAGLFGLLFVTGIVAALGFCACGVGILVTWPMYCLVLGIHYRAFFESGPANVPTA